MATIPPEQQIANVQAVLLEYTRILRNYWGQTMADARRLIDARNGYADRRGRRPKWFGDAWVAVSALYQWRTLKAAHAAGALPPIVTDDALPF